MLLPDPAFSSIVPRKVRKNRETGASPAIGLASAAASTNYGDALLVQGGGFTRSDGTKGQAGSFLLAQDSFVREFVSIEVSPAARALPNLGGSGWVRDLQEAATLEPELIERANAARTAPTRAGYAAAVAALAKALPDMGGSGWVRDLREAMSLGSRAAATYPLASNDGGTWRALGTRQSSHRRGGARRVSGNSDRTSANAGKAGVPLLDGHAPGRARQCHGCKSMSITPQREAQAHAIAGMST